MRERQPPRVIDVVSGSRPLVLPAHRGPRDRAVIRAALYGVEAAGIASADAPLFQGVAGGRGVGTATGRGLSPNAARSQLKRRLRAAGLPGNLRPHSFRVLVVTDLLDQGVALEDVQMLVGHSQPQTTALYDRRERRIARSVVERISI